MPLSELEEAGMKVVVKEEGGGNGASSSWTCSGLSRTS
jgi:hypothetical protein